MTLITLGRDAESRLARAAEQNQEIEMPTDIAGLLSELTDCCTQGDSPDDKPGTARRKIRSIYIKAKRELEKREPSDEDITTLCEIIETCIAKLNITLKPMGAAATRRTMETLDN